MAILLALINSSPMPSSLTSAANGPPLWVPIISSVVGGGIVGSFVSAYLTSGREGRAARAKVRECIFETENTRWADADYQKFHEALSKLEAAALIAKAPRELVERYVWLAEVAHYTEVAQRRENEFFPPRSLPLPLAALVRMSVEELTNHLWHPWSYRFRRTRSLWKIDQEAIHLIKEFDSWTWTVYPTPVRLGTKKPGFRAWVMWHMPKRPRNLKNLRRGPRSQP
jgi:hypothetical protein